MLAALACIQVVFVFCAPPSSLSKQLALKAIPPESLIAGSFSPTSEPPPPDAVYTLAINPAASNPCQTILLI